MSKCEFSCYNCTHVDVIPGHPGTYYDPPEPDEVVCMKIDVEDSLFEDDGPEEWAQKCGKFEPVMLEKCPFCNKEVSIPLYTIKTYVYNHFADEPVPVCSEQCKTAWDVANKLSGEEII